MSTAPTGLKPFIDNTYIVFMSDNGAGGLLKDLETGTSQLFDLEADLSEKNNLSESMPEKVKQLEELLGERLAAIQAQMPTQNPDYDSDADSGSKRRRK